MDGLNTVPKLLRARCAAFSESIAASDGERTLTYKGLLEGALTLAATCRLHGIGRGDRVMLLLPNSTLFVEAFFALALIGAVSVPVAPSSGDEEIAYCARDSEPKIILAAEGLLERASRLSEGARVVCASLPPGRFGENPPWLPATVEPEDDAVWLYSTGSTGKPKRVARSQLGLTLLAQNHARTIGWTKDDRVLFAVPLSHTYGLGNMLGVVASGASMHLVDGFNRWKVIEAIEREGITVFPAVPFMLSILAESHLPPGARFPSLRMVLSAGAPLSEGVFRRFSERFGIAPRQLYGSTETGLIAINMAPDIERRALSVGKPALGVEVKILREDGGECAPGETGEIVVRSPYMAKGYGNLPDETERAFRGGYYHTGDVGRVDGEGYIYIEGRKKLVINVAGNKVDPVEIENLLLSHPGVAEAVVLGAKDPMGEEVVKAVLVPKAPIDRAAIVDFLKGRVSNYKLPRIVELRDSLPRSPSGKVLREKLK
jgi:long-chain acyl-CoA synthetase